MESSAVKKFKKWIENAFAGEVSFEVLPEDERDEAPVLLKNKTGIRSF